MGSEWQHLQVKDIAETVASGPFGSNLRGYEYTEEGVPVIRGNNLAGPRFTASDYVFVSEVKADSLSSSLAYESDVIFAARGSVGAVGIIPQGKYRRYVLSSNLMKISVNAKKSDPLFVFYYFRSPFGQNEIQSYVNTTGVPKIERALESLRRFRVPCPPLHEQRAIAYMLGTLDGRIELNQGVIETLGEIAWAIFESWFMDFDPVRARTEGRKTGLAPALAEVFPDRFSSSEERGDVPAGWKVGQFGDLASQQLERVGKRDAVVLSATASGHLVRSEEHFSRRVHSKEIDRYLAVEQGDLAYNPSRINIGSVGMLDEALLGAVSPAYVVVRPEPVYRWFLDFSLRHPVTREWIKTLASGSVRQALSYYDFASIPCVIPPERPIQLWETVWAEIRRGIRARLVEIDVIGALRDTLLPKMLTGEIRVKDAERFLEDNA